MAMPEHAAAGGRFGVPRVPRHCARKSRANRRRGAPIRRVRGAALMDLDAFLRQHGIVASRHGHPPVMTVEESERLVPRLPGAKTKNLFLRDKKGLRHFLVTVAHDASVDLAALGVALGAGRLGFASAERLSKHLAVTPGSVSLLALVNDRAGAVEFVIDRAVWDASAVHAHPLVNDATMVIAHADLERFLAATGHAARVIDLPAAGPAAELR
jgi:Ala-tRNA(Pro) deacylase